VTLAGAGASGARTATPQFSARTVESAAWLSIAALAAGGLLIWVRAMSSVDITQLTDLGLGSVIPVWAYVAFQPLMTAFVLALAQPRFPTWLMVVLVAILILMLYGAGAMAEGVMRLTAAWRHLGVIDFVLRNGIVNPSVDAYHNWPGFFTVAAFVSSVAGIGSFAPIGTWAPVLFNLLYLPALYVIFDTLTTDRRVVWLGIWLFYSTNWIGQDYFAPQALGFFIYLVVVALALRALVVAAPDTAILTRGYGPLRLPARAAKWLTSDQVRVDEASRGQRVVLVSALLIVSAFLVSAHQLTPFFVLASLSALVVLLRLRWFELPVIIGVLVSGWVAFMAVPFLIGHFQNVVGYVGAFGEALEANLTGRLAGSREHQIVVYLRLVATGAMWLLAIAGVVRRVRAGRWDITAIALGLSPFPLFALQAYGGEMLLRIALFSLPLTAFLGAFAFVPRESRTMSGRAAVGVLLAGLVLLGSFVITRYGNERIESFTPNEVTAVEQLYKMAPEESLLVAVTGYLPWKTTRYERYHYRPLAGDESYFGDPDRLIADMAAYSGPAYLIVTRAQEAFVEMIQGQPAAAWDAFEARLLSDPRLVVVYRNRDAFIAEYRGVSS
jgi:hypothetical protein